MKAMVLAGGDDQRALIRELKQRNYTVLLADYYPNPVAAADADEHVQISTLDHDAVLSLATQEKVELVTTACTDQALLTAAYVSEKLDLPTPFSYSKARDITNKSYMKERFSECGIPSAAYRIFSPSDSIDLSGLNYPLVVKPVDSNGSKGISKVSVRADIDKAISEAAIVSHSKRIIVEEFKAGQELSVDAIVQNGQVEILMVSTSRKNKALQDYFPIVQSRYPAPLQNGVMARVQEVVQQIVAAFELNNTFLLVQFIHQNEELNVLEFSARIGGGSKHHFLQHVTGMDIIQKYVELLFGEIHPLDWTSLNKHVSVNYMYTSPGVFLDVEGLAALKEEHVIEKYMYYKTHGMQVDSCRASRDRVAAFIAEGETEEEMNARIEEADARLHVPDTDGQDILLHGLWRE